MGKPTEINLADLPGTGTVFTGGIKGNTEANGQSQICRLKQIRCPGGYQAYYLRSKPGKLCREI